MCHLILIEVIDMSDNVVMIVEELAFDGVVSLGKCSKRTVQRWAKRVNEYLEQNNYDWRVRPNIKDNTIEVQ